MQSVRDYLAPDTGEGPRYRSENADEFFDWLETMRREGRFSLALHRLEDIDEADLTYALALSKAQMWQNFAILGDNREDCDDETAVAGLKQSLAILLSILEEGKTDPAWLEAASYAYLYLEEEDLAGGYLDRWQQIETRPEKEELIQQLRLACQTSREERLNENRGAEDMSFDPAHREDYLAWLERINSACEYSRLIQSLEAIPEDQLDYELIMWKARGWQNYAIMGDGDEGQTDAQFTMGMLRSLVELRRIEKEGTNDISWLRRMVFVHQYLEEEDAAYPYLDRWEALETDPVELDRIRLIRKELKEAVEARANKKSPRCK